ncbi:MAG TPA: protein BatD [Candidatus Coprenecus stercorigallinarum]|nr:protein BatD [Candidatus Coprenecus stercorigallinarum]
MITGFYRKFSMTAAAAVFALMCAYAAAAQNSFTVDAPAVVSTDEIFQVVFTATYESGKISDFTPPSFEGFEVLAGPVQSTSTNYQNINGQSSTTHTRSYTYTVRVVQEGKVTVPSASIKIGKDTYTTDPKTVEAVKGQVPDGGSSSAGQRAGDDLRLRVSVSKTRVVVGEPVIVTLKLYVQSSAISGFEDVRFPTFDGFWSQEIDAPQNIQFVRENYDGQIYNAALLRRYMLLPQQTGTLTIEPSELVCLLQIQAEQTGPRSIFDDFFSSYQTIRKRVASEPVTINVSALPAGAPASFTGGVGSFRLSAGFDSDSVAAHEATSLKITISGTGNINLVDAPKVRLPADFESYDVRKTENITTGASGSTGTLTFEYPFIPRAPGTFDLEPVEFTYYDIDAGRYRTLSSGPLSLKVGEGTRTDAAVIPSGVSKRSVESLGEDIRFISTTTNLRKAGRMMVSSPAMIIIPTVILLAAAAVWVLLARSIVRRSDVAGTRNRKAMKVARARLKNASAFLRQGLYGAFYEELHKALHGYISDKLMLPVADLTRERIGEELRARGKDEAVIQELSDILDACEYARYAPASGSEAMEKHYQQAVKVISQIES